MSAYPGISMQNRAPSLKILLIHRVIHSCGEKSLPKIHSSSVVLHKCDAPQFVKSKVNATLVIFNTSQVF